ncbi:folliculin-interacting protein N-terminus-domain-containing protein [Xylariaceae sp. FL0016]|nr:folliculin-interacting protein N-terminus-domain-containing protein [Xylariaceae sp. FL0016]
MLGKLFNLTSGAAAGDSSLQDAPGSKLSPESVQEDIHTRSLLFPDTQALYHRDDQVFPLPSVSALSGSQPGAFDYDADIEIDVRDVRVIIMQDTLGSVNPSLLFDSQAAPTAEKSGVPTANTSQSSAHDARRVPTSPRKGSLGQPSRPLVIQPGSPQPRQGAFDRRGSIQSRNYSSAENDSQRAAREYREELASFSSCIFANSEVMAYKGTSTKVHIIPSETKGATVPSSLLGDGRGSMGRSSMRSSRLAQSFTSEAPSRVPASSGPSRQSERSKILITRLFPVNLPSDDAETPQGRSEDNGGFPFPCSPDETNTKRKKPKPVPKRTPMYAVALVLQLPSNPTSANITAPKPTFRTSSSYTEQDAFPSSFGSARRSGWTMVGSGYGSESFESAYNNDMEDRMDVITQHWDIIMRTLTHLQSVVASALFPMLKQADLSAPNPHPANVPANIPAAQIARTSSVHSRRGSDASQMKQPKQYAKLVALSPNSLMQDERIGQEVADAKVRIVTGLRATRVVTGQGRWGPWRDEARWVAKWAGGKEQGFFFFNLLTGFLATHKDWLQALSPIWYRRRHYQQQKAKNEEDTSLPSRTIIIAKDKMAARRLIFLLSAFLPANQQLPTIRAQRPATSASFAAFGHSPPSYVVPINKEESLRRKINRRPGQRGHSHSRSFSTQSQATTRSTTGIPAQLAHLSIESQQHHERRSSEFFKPANLPIAGSDLNTRKSSAATSNTVMPDAAIPHFSTMHRRSLRPESSGSMAADDLKRSLKRVDSPGHASHGSTDSRSSRWGSVISGLWSTRRRDSTASTSQTLEIPSQYDAPLMSPTKVMAAAKRDKLAEMVQEVQGTDTPAQGHFGQGNVAAGDEPDTPRRLEAKQLDRTPDPSGAYESPVKTSINNDDGVIDVDVQFPEYLTSFETAVSSPSSSGYLSTPGIGSGLDAFEQFSRLAIDGDVPLNVAGWLQRFHPDFTLQAIPPQKDLLDQVRDSLRAEPTPTIPPSSLPSEWPMEHWVDVSSAIVADTTTFTIKRLRYRRLVIPKPAADRTPSHYLSPYGSSVMTPALSPYEQPIEDKIEEEVLVTLDDALIDAVEKVIMQSSDVSKVTSAASSRSVSKRRERRDSVASEPVEDPGQTDTRLDIQEVPRAECKTVVLSALSSIVQDVVDQREIESHSSSRDAPYFIKREKESALRAAIRAWIESVEGGDG